MAGTSHTPQGQHNKNKPNTAHYKSIAVLGKEIKTTWSSGSSLPKSLDSLH